MSNILQAYLLDPLNLGLITHLFAPIARTALSVLLIRLGSLKEKNNPVFSNIDSQYSQNSGYIISTQYFNEWVNEWINELLKNNE